MAGARCRYADTRGSLTSMPICGNTYAHLTLTFEALTQNTAYVD